MDRFAALTSFVAVIEHGGFAPAARRLGVAPSSLTRQLNTLEEALGTQLLNRSTRRVTLTEAGPTTMRMPGGSLKSSKTPIGR
jgi:DNA-binding transcriptional LysR family regulator